MQQAMSKYVKQNGDRIKGLTHEVLPEEQDDISETEV